MKNKIVLLTGATGLIGSYLLKILIENGHKVFCLSRTKDDKSAYTRVLKSLKFWLGDAALKHKSKLVVLEGDIRKKKLGLSKENIIALKEEVQEIFHCAAKTEFTAPIDDLRNVNVKGVKNILDLGINLYRNGKLIKANYISTLYVCGDYRGKFMENSLDIGQKFSIPYEQSKFEAEVIVREYRRKKLWVDIYRPPAVVGESTTGKILSFNQAFYQALRVMNQEIFESLPCRNARIDIMFVDELCRCIYKLSMNSSLKKINNCYNLNRDKGLSVEMMLSFTSEFLKVKKPEFVSKEKFMRNNLTFTQKALLQHNFFFLERNVKFVSLLTRRALNELDFKFQKFQKDNLLNLLRYAVKRKYLKKK